MAQDRFILWLISGKINFHYLKILENVPAQDRFILWLISGKINLAVPR
jgi:hypothetical protein